MKAPSSQPQHPAAKPEKTTLRDLVKGESATVVGFDPTDLDLETRLREIGFAEGDEVEALYWGLFGRNPMTVRLNGALIAMRKVEAQAVWVRKL